MSELHAVTSDDSRTDDTQDFDFSDLKPVSEAYKFTDGKYSRWGLLRETRLSQFNGMDELGVVVMIKNKKHVDIPAFKRWFMQKHGIRR